MRYLGSQLQFNIHLAYTSHVNQAVRTSFAVSHGGVITFILMSSVTIGYYTFSDSYEIYLNSVLLHL